MLAVVSVRSVSKSPQSGVVDGDRLDAVEANLARAVVVAKPQKVEAGEAAPRELEPLSLHLKELHLAVIGGELAAVRHHRIVGCYQGERGRSKFGSACLQQLEKAPHGRRVGPRAAVWKRSICTVGRVLPLVGIDSEVQRFSQHRAAFRLPPCPQQRICQALGIRRGVTAQHDRAAERVGSAVQLRGRAADATLGGSRLHVRPAKVMVRCRVPRHESDGGPVVCDALLLAPIEVLAVATPK
eukprot:7001869-Prymnesium_polylepis.1